MNGNKILPVLTAFLLVFAWTFAALSEQAGQQELLYNGIRLPKQWPPRLAKLDREPMPLPYLEHPPKVVPIDVGRQLLVDDFLVEQTDLKRTFYQAEYHPASPVLKPDRPWEMKGRHPSAMVFSDGVWYDPAEKLFKMWYMGGYCLATCYATSTDGIHWKKPSLDIEPGTNIVQRRERDSVTVWLDHRERDPKRRFKMFSSIALEGKRVLAYYVSADGIHWSDRVAVSPGMGDRTTVFYNPFRNVWVYSIRSGVHGLGRTRCYREHPDAEAGLSWKGSDVYLWTGADRLDPHNPNPEFNKIPPQLYNLDAVAYESLIVGFFSVWQGDQSGHGFRKRNEVLLGFSRDGFHWDRPDHRPFAGVNETDGVWNWGNIQSAGGGCLVVGDKLYFYVSGRAKSRASGPDSTGLAILRRDGFASLDAGEKQGTLTTRPVRFRGNRLFVNVDAEGGELLVEVLDENQNVIGPFGRENCIPIRADKTLLPVRWKGAADLSALAGKPVRFRFCLKQGHLYSFWVSPDRSGASHGYVAAGGPGFTGPTDTQGSAAYRAVR